MPAAVNSLSVVWPCRAALMMRLAMNARVVMLPVRRQAPDVTVRRVNRSR
jgi:hypothetical protein